MDCLFCAIIRGEIPSQKVYEDEYVFAFKDINPVAPVHILVVPKVHMDSIDDLTIADGGTRIREDHIFNLLKAVPHIASSQGLTNGYRLITNVGEDGRQSVKHLHFHIIGGRKLMDRLT